MLDIVFTEKQFLWGLLLIIPLIYVIFFREKKRYGTVVFSNVRTLKDLAQKQPRWHRLIPDILTIIALIAMICALAKPKLLDETESIEVSGIDIAFVLDISTSMSAIDFHTMNRLDLAKEVIDDFIKKRVNDRLALIVFNAISYIQTPLTLDHKIFSLILKSLTMKEIRAKVELKLLEDGTAIGNALGTAVNALKDQKTKSKIAILLTDGSNNRGNMTPETAAEIAQKAGIKIYPILVGRRGKVRIPDGQGGFQYALNSVNPELLQKIAKITKAQFHTAQNQSELKKNLNDIIDHLERSTFQDDHFRDRPTTYHPFLLLALALLILGFLFQVKRFKRLP